MSDIFKIELDKNIEESLNLAWEGMEIEMQIIELEHRLEEIDKQLEDSSRTFLNMTDAIISKV